MCGVAGGVSIDIDLRRPLERASENLSRRGPDGYGSVTVGPATLVHRRLAVIDPSERSAQPMQSPDGRFTLSFNGEIYNYREVASQLPEWRFRTSSDTEVLLAVLASHGEAGLSRVRGMYAFLLWDAVREELLAARDPYGIKPLYYSRLGRGVIFGSTCKALLASGLVSHEVDPVGEASFWLAGSVAEPSTWFRDIKAVPAGHFVRADAHGSIDIQPFQLVDTPFLEEPLCADSDRLQSLVQETVIDSVRLHEVSDVPISILLSGGIDSAAVAGCLTNPGHATAVTIAFDEYDGLAADESGPASTTARHFGMSHQIRRVHGDEFVADIERILLDMDQPSVDGVNTWFAARAVAEAGFKVALSGVGGDELFHGYGHFQTVPALVSGVRRIRALPLGDRALVRVAQVQARRTRQTKWLDLPTASGDIAGALRLRRGVFGRTELASLMGEERAAAGVQGVPASGGLPKVGGGPGRLISYLEAVGYLRNQLLRDADWASMAHGVELRTPLVDYELLRRLAPYEDQLGTRRPKEMLALAPPAQVPGEVRDRAKVGFNIPVQHWLKRSGQSVSNHPTLDWALAVGRAFGASPVYSKR